MTANANGPLKTFLRGGQVTLHTLRMFGQVIRFLAGAMISLMLVIAYLGTKANTSPEERHYAMKRYEAQGYRLLRAPLHTELNMLTASGEHRPFPLSVILTNSAVSEHERGFRKTTLR
ncbi:hypothetical protein HK107_07805 [Parvularcula sp. ZS-1/3]|uniref:Uncharacterized protein n=1 Tax=Parvularcula mediterranea TaxID=2732508 RepID=A0A7Y3W5E7_9PROT|nr:hypothetical protein [Parvularcula mediterranea]NNU16222.1 hypothetical protein [Parvularcula mediterranea]